MAIKVKERDEADAAACQEAVRLLLQSSDKHLSRWTIVQDGVVVAAVTVARCSGCCESLSSWFEQQSAVVDGDDDEKTTLLGGVGPEN